MSRPPRPVLMALLADVKQNPDDLTPWLVLCDWLEEQDDEADRARGEYCRLCFDKLGTKPSLANYEGGERRRKLFRRWREEWLGPIAPLEPIVKKGLLTIRGNGFLDRLEALRDEPELWAWVGKLQTWGGFAALFPLTRDLTWAVAGLNTLELLEPLDDKKLAVLASCTHLRQLRVLKLQLPKLNPTKAKCLVESPFLDGLRVLDIDCFDAQRPGAGWIAARKRLREAFGERLVLRHVPAEIE